MIIEQTFVSERGRRRRRGVRVDLDEVRRGLGIPASPIAATGNESATLLEETVGESQFAIWLEPVELIAIDGERGSSWRCHR